MKSNKKLIYDNSPWLKVYEKNIEISNSKKKYSTVERPNAITVIPISKSNKTILLKVFRVGTQEYSWEFPAGFIDKDETPEQAAIRELKEETQLEVESVRHLGKYYPVPSLMSEIVDIFIAGIKDKQLDNLGKISDKDVKGIKTVDISEIFNIVSRGEITDGFTLVGLLFLERYLK